MSAAAKDSPIILMAFAIVRDFSACNISVELTFTSTSAALGFVRECI